MRNFSVVSKSAKIKCLEVCEKGCFPKISLKVDSTYDAVDILISSVTSTE